MNAILNSGVAEVAAIADPSAQMAAEAAQLAPQARQVGSLAALLDLDLDGVVIATPSAQHAAQCIEALERGVAVFCQKPLGRTAGEAAEAVAAARRADRLLGVDFSYRFTDAMRRIRDLAQSGALGRIYAADLTFHNAFGPEKAWFRDPALSGGGCVMDLGVHLVDLALWTLDFPEVRAVSEHLFAEGEPLSRPPARTEDYAIATLHLHDGAIARLACSWWLSAGRDAVISATFYGTQGAASLQNVAGSFYDFTAEHHRGTVRETLSAPPDDWGGRAAISWADRLAHDPRFDPAAAEFVAVARILDRVYGRTAPSP